ncbi:MAG: Flp pilus assembly protein CpaB [Kordiimonas sp.]
MNPRGLILLVLAAIGVALVIMFTRSFLTSAQQQAQTAQVTTAKTPAVQILVAKRDLHVGTILKPEDAGWQAWPQAGLTSAYYVSKQDKLKSVHGKVVRVPITAGEPVTKTSIVAQGERGFLAAILTPGMRAVSIKLSPTAGIGGFVFPGDRVDVILTHELKVSRSETYQVAETVFQNVRILAVDQKSQTDDKVKIAKTATIEVTPKMAEKVAMLSNIGTLSLSLRSLAQTAEGTGADPDSPPVPTTTSHSMGSEVSGFLPSLDSQSIRVARGSDVNLVKTSVSNSDSGEGDDQ